jgi:hypothetical protein
MDSSGVLQNISYVSKISVDLSTATLWMDQSVTFPSGNPVLQGVIGISPSSNGQGYVLTQLHTSLVAYVDNNGRNPTVLYDDTLLITGTTDPAFQAAFGIGLSIDNHYLISSLSDTYVADITPNPPCFLEGTRILVWDHEEKRQKYVPIETIRPGMLVKTYMDGYLPVDMIGTSIIQNPDDSFRVINRLYRYPKGSYPVLNEDLVMTGCHSILVDSLTPYQQKYMFRIHGTLPKTDGKYRCMMCLDGKAEPYAREGIFRVWHLALESDHPRRNYGVYVAGGLLVETCSQRYMRECSGMKLISGA